jgi:hypothetical protein
MIQVNQESQFNVLRTYLLLGKVQYQTFRRDTPAVEFLRRPIDIFRTCDYQVKDPFYLNNYPKQLDILATSLIQVS